MHNHKFGMSAFVILQEDLFWQLFRRAQQVETEAKDKADTELLLHFTILSSINQNTAFYQQCSHNLFSF